MKYFIVPNEAILFKQNNQVVVPSQQVVEENIINIFRDGFDSTFAVRDIEDAVRLAHEYDPEKNNNEGFLILEVERRERAKKDVYNLQINENETQALNGFVLPSRNLTFIKAHLGHLDVTLQDNVVVLNAKYEDIFNRRALIDPNEDNVPDEVFVGAHERQDIQNESSAQATSHGREIEAEIETEIEAETETEIETEIETEVEIEAEAEAEVETETKKAEAEVAAEVESEAEVETKAEATTSVADSQPIIKSVLMTAKIPFDIKLATKYRT